MAKRQNTFLLKRSNVPGKIPLPGDLRLGELALNTADVKLYTSGTTQNNIIQIGWDRINRTGDTVTGDYNFTGDISISGSSLPQGYALSITGDTNFSGDVYVNGDLFYDGSVIITGSTIINNGLTANTIYTDYIDFNTNYSGNTNQVIGRLNWSVDDGTLEIGMGGVGEVTQQIGLQQFFLVKNQTGSQLDKGKVIRASGTLGNSARILADYMIADNTIPYYFTLGIATQDIDDGDDGYVTNFGLVRGINTTGSLYGETWVDGDILYVSSTITGGLTKFEPNEPNLKIQIALVIKANANGSMFVRPDLGSRLEDLHDLQTSGATNGDLISFDSLDSIWKYTKTLNGNYTVNGQTLFSGSSDNVVTIVGNGSTNPLFTISGSSGELFSVSDNLTGDLLSVNNVNSDPILIVRDDNTVLFGTNPTLSLNTTINETVLSGNVKTLYVIPSGYTSSYFDYNVFGGNGVRAGNVMGIWSGTSIQYTEVSTNDIGNTSDFNIYMEMSGTTTLLVCSATTYNWDVKSIVRLI